LELKPDLAGGGGTSYSRLERGRGVVVVCQEGGVAGGALGRVLARLREELVPLQISGKIGSLYNRTAEGWLITLVNNEGITKSNNEPPRIDPVPQLATVRYTGPGSVRSVCLWTPEGDEPLDPADIHIPIPPGEVRVVRLALAPVLR
jgi:hypothetical protein